MLKWIIVLFKIFFYKQTSVFEFPLLKGVSYISRQMLLSSGTQTQVTHIGCPPKRMCTLEADGSTLKMKCIFINPAFILVQTVCVHFLQEALWQEHLQEKPQCSARRSGLPPGQVPKPPRRSPTGTTPHRLRHTGHLKHKLFQGNKPNSISCADSDPRSPEGGLSYVPDSPQQKHLPQGKGLLLLLPQINLAWS